MGLQLQREDRADLGARGHQKVTAKSMGVEIPTETSVPLRPGGGGGGWGGAEASRKGR